MGLIIFLRAQLDAIGGFQTKLALVININFIPKLNSCDDNERVVYYNAPSLGPLYSLPPDVFPYPRRVGPPHRYCHPTLSDVAATYLVLNVLGDHALFGLAQAICCLKR